MSFLERQFKLQKNHTTVKTEIIAGVTTFMTMAYIIFVNPSVLSATGMPADAIMAATCISAALATFLMAFLANYPIALAAGMGLNFFFAFSVVLNPDKGMTWQMALAAIFIGGVIFMLLALTKLRDTIVNTIPKSLKIGISSGIGLLIAFVGLQSAGIVVADQTTLVKLCSFKGNATAILAMAGLILMVTLECYKIAGGILIGIFIMTAVGVPLGMVRLVDSFVSAPPSVAPIFMSFDFSKIGDSGFWLVVFTFFFIHFFDAVGTLVGVCNRGGLLDKNGRLLNAKGALMANAIGTVAGSVLGTSTVTSYVESASGIAQGGRTGLTAVVTGILFLAALFFSPLVGIIPAYATAPALIMVGIYMMMGMRDLDFDEWTEFTPSALAFFIIPLSYDIAVGIEFGVVSYVVLKIMTGKFKNVSWVMVGLTTLFIFKELYI